MEIEARVVAATLDFMQITSLDDTPPEDVLPLSLVDATAETQKKFLKDLAFQIVDTYVVNETNINALMEELQKKRRADVGVLADGRFGAGFLVAQSLLPLMVKDVLRMRRPMGCTRILQLPPPPLLPRTMSAITSLPYWSMVCCF